MFITLLIVSAEYNSLSEIRVGILLKEIFQQTLSFQKRLIKLEVYSL